MGWRVRVKVQPRIDEVDTGALADLHMRGVLAGEESLGTVEDHVSGVFVGDGLAIGLHEAGFGAARVDLGLHDIELVVDRWQWVNRVDEDAPIHALGDVQRHVAERAVVHEHAWVQQACLDGRRLAWRDRRVRGAPALSGHGVEVDIVRHRVGRRVGDGEAQHVTDAGSDDGTGKIRRSPGHRPARDSPT